MARRPGIRVEGERRKTEDTFRAAPKAYFGKPEEEDSAASGQDTTLESEGRALDWVIPQDEPMTDENVATSHEELKNEVLADDVPAEPVTLTVDGREFEVNPMANAPKRTRLLLFSENGEFVVGHNPAARRYDPKIKRWVDASAFSLWPANLALPFAPVGWLVAPDGVF